MFIEVGETRRTLRKLVCTEVQTNVYGRSDQCVRTYIPMCTDVQPNVSHTPRRGWNPDRGDAKRVAYNCAIRTIYVAIASCVYTRVLHYETGTVVILLENNVENNSTKNTLITHLKPH